MAQFPVQMYTALPPILPTKPKSQKTRRGRELGLALESSHLSNILDLGANPLDLSFNVDPSPLLSAPATCEYSCVSDDVTRTSPVQTFDLSVSTKVIESSMNADNDHLQQKEKQKLMWDSKTGTVTYGKIEGDRAIGELIGKLIILIPMIMDPHEQLCPFMVRFFIGTSPK